MKKLLLLFKKKLKKLSLFSFIAFIFYFIYCLPYSLENFTQSLFDLILLSLFLYFFPILSGRINHFTGGDEYFSKIPKFEYFPFVFCIPMFIIGIIGMVIVLFTKNFEVSLMFMPSLFGIKGSLKEYERYLQEIGEIKK